MLDKLLARLYYHRLAFLESGLALFQKPLANAMTVLVIAMSLSLPTIFWVFMDNLQAISQNWGNSSHISLYLKPNLEASESQSLLRQIQETNGVGQASIKTPAEGLAELQAEEGMQDIMRYLPENPLPSLVEVIPALDMDSALKIDQLYQELKQLPQVAEAKIDMDWIKRLHAILGFSGSIAQGLMLFLASTVVLIIANTLRLAIQNRREEIQVLKLIGATNAYIARPFLYTGLWYGLAAALACIILVDAFLLQVAHAARHLTALYQMDYPLSGLSFGQSLQLLVAAGFLGWLGAALSVRRQLQSMDPNTI